VRVVGEVGAGEAHDEYGMLAKRAARAPASSALDAEYALAQRVDHRRSAVDGAWTLITGIAPGCRPMLELLRQPLELVG